MKYLWITLSLLTALVIGCNSDTSTDDAAPDDGSASVTSDSGTVDLPAMDETELTNTEPSDDASDQPTSDEVTSTDDAAQNDGMDPIRKDIDTRLRTAIGNQDLPAALAVLEDGIQKLPGDADIVRALVALRIQNDMRIAGEGDKEAAAASMKETAEVVKNLLGEEITIPGQLLPLWYINEARRHAHANDVEQTLAAMNQARENGFTQFAAMVEDPFFNTIKENEEFKQALQDIYRETARQKLAEAEPFDFNFELTDLENNPIKLADYAGKIVIVDIWGTWCPPCKMEIPHFIQLQDTYKDDLAIIGITYERFEGEDGSMSGVYELEENRSKAQQAVIDFAKSAGINYTIALGDEATQGMIPSLEGFPTTLFIDREGKVRLKVVGYHPYAQLESYVAELMADQESDKPTG